MNFEFLDFDLRFEADGTDYRAVVRSSAGERQARVDQRASVDRIAEGFGGLVENFAWQSRREIEIAGVTGTKTGNGPPRSSSYDAELSISFYLTKSGLFIGRV